LGFAVVVAVIAAILAVAAVVMLIVIAMSVLRGTLLDAVQVVVLQRMGNALDALPDITTLSSDSARFTRSRWQSVSVRLRGC